MVAIERAERDDQYRNIGNKILSALDDKDWARENFEKAAELVETYREYSDLITSIADGLNDKEWVEKLTMKKIALADNIWDMTVTAMTIYDELENEQLSKDAFKKAMDMAEDDEEYMYISECIKDNKVLNSKDWANEIALAAEKKAKELES